MNVAVLASRWTCRAAENGEIVRTLFTADMKRVLALTKDNVGYKLDALPDDRQLIPTLRRHKVDISIMPAREDRHTNDFVRGILVPGLILGFLLYMTRRLQNGRWVDNASRPAAAASDCG